MNPREEEGSFLNFPLLTIFRPGLNLGPLRPLSSLSSPSLPSLIEFLREWSDMISHTERGIGARDRDNFRERDRDRKRERVQE